MHVALGTLKTAKEACVYEMHDNADDSAKRQQQQRTKPRIARCITSHWSNGMHVKGQNTEQVKCLALESLQCQHRSASLWGGVWHTGFGVSTQHTDLACGQHQLSGPCAPGAAPCLP